MQTQITEVVQCIYGLHKYMRFKHTNHYIDSIHVVCSYTSYHKNIYINPTWHIVFIPPPPEIPISTKPEGWELPPTLADLGASASTGWLLMFSNDAGAACHGGHCGRSPPLGSPIFLQNCCRNASKNKSRFMNIYDDFKSRSHSETAPVFAKLDQYCIIHWDTWMSGPDGESNVPKM